VIEKRRWSIRWIGRKWTLIIHRPFKLAYVPPDQTIRWAGPCWMLTRKFVPLPTPADDVLL
jgi:hypothetical protein